MKNLDQLIAEELENIINSEDRRTAITLERFAKALLAELVVEKKESRMTDSLTGQMQIATWNACVDAFEQNKKTLLS